MLWFIYDSLRVWAWMKCVGSLVNLDQARPPGSRPANINAIMMMMIMKVVVVVVVKIMTTNMIPAMMRMSDIH